ncbi:MAG: hypothetical protein AB1490_05295 [Pseudomonadota bacterium]
MKRGPTRPRHKVSGVPSLDFAGFRRAIHSIGDLTTGISVSRKNINPEKLEHVVSSMMSNGIYKSIIAPDPFPKTYSEMKSKPFLVSLPLEHEIIWIAGVLAAFSNEINRGLSLQKRYSDALLHGDVKSAEAVLDETTEEVGVSIWLINARLSLSRVTNNGTKRTEELNKVVSAPNVSPLVACLAFYLSRSLDENATIADIMRDFSDGHPSNSYFQCHVCPFDFDTISDPKNCLWYEQNSPILDRYATLIEMLELLFARQNHLESVRRAVVQLSMINDVRLKNLAYYLNLANSEPYVDSRYLDAYQNYITGNNQAAAQILDAFQVERVETAWSYELAARVDSALKKVRAHDSLANEVVSQIQSFLDLNKDLSDVRSALQALGFQLRKTATAKAIASLLDRSASLPICNKFTATQVSFAIASPISDCVNYSLLKTVAPASFARWAQDRAGADSLVHRIGMLAIGLDQYSPAADWLGSVHPKIRELNAAYHYYNIGNYPEATKHFDAYNFNPASGLDPRATTFQYAMLKQQRLLAPALRAFVDAVFVNSRSHTLYDMHELRSWAVSEAAIDSCSIDRAIMLHVYSANYLPDQPGDLSDALEDTLDHFGVRKPSELLDFDIERSRLIYFSRYVATIDRLEDTTRFDNLDDIESERIKVLQWLVERDAANRGSYTQEVSAITKDQEVARLSVEFERSKIYVHEEGVKRTFDAEIRPAFLRYRQLIADPQLDAALNQIEQRLREIIKHKDAEFNYLIIPSSERDNIYREMVRRAYEVLLTDPIHGFKTYLSTRILHGVLEGELRSSFVNAGLLVAVDSKSKENEFWHNWENRKERIAEGSKAEIAAAVVKFSDRVTEQIATLKDQRIRIWSSEARAGIFRVNISTEAFLRLKATIAATSTYEEFIERLLASFWESMESCLTAVKQEIRGPFRKEINAAFSALESSLLALEGDRPREMLDAIAKCRAAFGQDVDRVSGWFVRAGVLAREPFLVETAVSVASRITNNCYPRHPLAVSFQCDRSYMIKGELLNPVVDLLTNCFQNAAEHSGFRDIAPGTAVKVQMRDDGSIFVEVLTELSDAIDLEKCASEISSLMREENLTDPNLVAMEGKTGIRKMKRILKHDFRSNEPLVLQVRRDTKQVYVAFNIPRACVNEHSAH